MATIPSQSIISNVVIEHNIPNFKTESMSLIERTKSRGLHRIEGSLSLTTGGTIQAQKELNAFVIANQGSLNYFDLKLPRHYASENLTTNPTTPNSYNVGANQILVSGFTGTIYAGSAFTIPNDSKVYFVTNTVTDNGTIEFYPAIRQNILAGSALEFIEPSMRLRFKEDKQKVVHDQSGFILLMDIEFVEAL